jgi:hypothetical protein
MEKVVRKVVQGQSYRGVYEVLEYEATLELEDPEGKRWGSPESVDTTTSQDCL